MKYFVVCLSTCAAAVLSNVARADDAPVIVWFDQDPAATGDKLAILCSDRKAAVVEQDEHHVLCQREEGGFKGALMQSLMGNSYSTTPQLMVRFSILRDGKSTRVQAQQWIELQMAMGQVRRTNLSGKKQNAQLIQTLVDLGAHTERPATQTTPSP